VGKKVNLFVIGAPKCGTTALCSYLSEHDDIFLSKIKEPHYFAHEFGYFADRVPTEKEYHALFSEAKGSESIFMEGSVYYLYAKDSIKKIKEYNSNTKIIVMLRNPVDMVQSMHSQLVWTQDEDIQDFELAWNSQVVRKEGKCIPRKCREPAFLQYKQLCSLGEQVERLLTVFDREDVFFIDYDEFRKDTRSVYEGVLEYLSVTQDGRSDFKVINSNKAHKFKFIAGFTERPPEFLVRLLPSVKSFLGLDRLGLMDLIRRVSSEKKNREKVGGELESKLKGCFRHDVEKLSELLGQDFIATWKF